ncbi:PH domain-containing protein [Microbacteriaceae bacterium VKM Ac-2855]|nr:PH domain-containing protein [Microbacteriaceae bacterium VKM Ac-2855]
MTGPSEPTGPTGPTPPLEAVTGRVAETDLADGEWHRLHPASPVLKGGVALIAVAAIVIGNLRERLIEWFIPGSDRYDSGDPVTQLIDSGLIVWALLAVLGVILLAVFGFWLSWRMHTFRVTDEVVEVRSGILFRTNRRARLDRIQGINVQRPVLARLFGAAKLEVTVAGQDGNVQLSYLGWRSADALRRDILRLATGVKAREAGVADAPHAAAGAPPTAGEPAAGFVARRYEEISAEFVDDTPPESLVHIHPARLIGSLVFSGFTLFLLAAVAAMILAAVYGSPWVLFAILPGVIGSAGYYVRRFVRSLRYSIAGTPDGVRVGFGVLSTSSDTIPPGRIHAVEVTQPLLWRPFGWWEVRIDRAGHASNQGANGDPNTTILPVGDFRDVQRVLGLLLPGLYAAENAAVVDAALRSRDADGFSAAPRRAVWLRPFSWRRTGYRHVGDLALLRSGAIWRRLQIVPMARMQSIGIRQGPIHRILDLAAAQVHTVAGPVTAGVGVMSRADALRFFAETSAAAVLAADREGALDADQPASTALTAPSAPVVAPAAWAPPVESDRA